MKSEKFAATITSSVTKQWSYSTVNCVTNNIYIFIWFTQNSNEIKREIYLVNETDWLKLANQNKGGCKWVDCSLLQLKRGQLLQLTGPRNMSSFLLNSLSFITVNL